MFGKLLSHDQELIAALLADENDRDQPGFNVIADEKNGQLCTLCRTYRGRGVFGRLISLPGVCEWRWQRILVTSWYFINYDRGCVFCMQRINSLPIK